MRMFELNDYGKHGTSEELLQEFASIVSRECKPFLEAIDYHVSLFALYRGLGTESSQMIQKDVRLDGRRPTDTPMDIHDAVNGYFKHKFGQPYRDAVFTSGAPHVTLSFGHLYTIFPKGNFTFVWSPEVFDLWVEHKNSLRMWADYADPEPFVNWMDSLGYRNDNLPAAIDSNKEIMIRCESYYAFRIHPTGAADTILKALEEEIRLNK